MHSQPKLGRDTHGEGNSRIMTKKIVFLVSIFSFPFVVYM